MRTPLALALGLLISISLTACSKSETSAEKVEAANTNIERLNTIASTLASDGFSLSPADGMLRVFTGMKPEKVATVRGLLNEYVSLGGDVKAKTTDSDVIFADGAKLTANIGNAQKYLTLLDGYEAKEQDRLEAIEKINSKKARVTDGWDKVMENYQKAEQIVQKVYLRTGIDLRRDSNTRNELGETNQSKLKTLTSEDVNELENEASTILSIDEQQLTIIASLTKELGDNNTPEFGDLNTGLAHLKMATISDRDATSANLTAIKKERDARAKAQKPKVPSKTTTQSTKAPAQKPNADLAPAEL